MFPTFPVVMGYGAGGRSVMADIGTFNPAMLVHGQQAVTLHRPIPPAGTATVTSTLTDMFDKGKAAVVVTTSDVDDGRRAALQHPLVGVHPRRGRLGRRPRPVRPAERAAGPRARPPVTYQTSPDQAFLYRLNGDRNPLHTDPSFAAAGGFPKPILHGLCSYGFTGRACCTCCAAATRRAFHHIEARFASPVMPGEALTVKAWETGDGEAVFTTSVGDRVVIDQGLLRYA